MDFVVQRFTRHCATTGRELQPGEVFYSTLVAQGAEVVRHDYAADAWHGPPAGILGWWKSQVPARDTRRVQMAPNDVMLDLLEQLEPQESQLDLRYVLSLLLVRRRVLRVEDVQTDEAGREVTLLYCARREVTYRVRTRLPSAEREAEIQQQLSQLLFSNAAPAPVPATVTAAESTTTD